MSNTVKNTPVLYCPICNAAVAMRGETQQTIKLFLPMSTVSRAGAQQMDISHPGCAGVAHWYTNAVVTASSPKKEE